MCAKSKTTQDPVLRRGVAQKARRSSRSQPGATVSGAIPINALTLERWQLVQTAAVAIAGTTDIYALLFCRLRGRDGAGRIIGVARMERSNAQRQKHREQQRDDRKRPLAPSFIAGCFIAACFIAECLVAAFHGSAPFRLGV